MDIGTISQLIGSYGFPVVACCAIAYFCYKQIIMQKDENEKHRAEILEINKVHREEIAELNEKHADEVAKMTEAVNNNTLALQRLADKLGGGAVNEN